DPAVVVVGRSEAAALSEHQFGGGAGGKRSVVFEHPAVAGVGDVEVAAGVHRNPIGGKEAGGADPAVVVVGRSEAAALSEHQFGGGAGGKRSVVFEHPAVAGVGDVEVAAGVHRNPIRG